MESALMLGDAFEFWDIGYDIYNAIRTAELAAEGAGVRASVRAGLVHRAALALLGASLLLGIAMLLLPALRPWSGQAVWVLILGLAAYMSIVAIVYWSPPVASAPELRKVQKIRHGIVALRAERQATRGARQDPVLMDALSDAIRHLDEQVIPALQQLVERRAKLERELARYYRQEIHAPSPDVLDRLRRLQARLRVVIDECVQQAANAYATLVALLQEGDDAVIAARARSWADGLLTLYDSLAEVLQGTDEPHQADTGPARDTGRQAADRDAVAAAVTGGESVDQRDSPIEVLTPLVEEALRRVNDPGRLAESGLLGSLPCTVAYICSEQRNGRLGNPTPLEQARALREILLSALRRLRPDDGVTAVGGGEKVRFHVLWYAYVDGMSTRQIMSRYGISESTLHRYRRDGVRVLARELREQEDLLRRN